MLKLRVLDVWEDSSDYLVALELVAGSLNRGVGELWSPDVDGLWTVESRLMSEPVDTSPDAPVREGMSLAGPRTLKAGMVLCGE